MTVFVYLFLELDTRQMDVCNALSDDGLVRCAFSLSCDKGHHIYVILVYAREQPCNVTLACRICCPASLTHEEFTTQLTRQQCNYKRTCTPDLLQYVGMARIWYQCAETGNRKRIAIATGLSKVVIHSLMSFSDR